MQVVERQKIQVIKNNNGKATHVIMPIEVFQQVLDDLDDEMLLVDMLKMKEDEPSYSAEEAFKMIESDEG